MLIIPHNCHGILGQEQSLSCEIRREGHPNGYMAGGQADSIDHLATPRVGRERRSIGKATRRFPRDQRSKSTMEVSAMTETTLVRSPFLYFS
jgi:hypothetical protein